MCLYKSNVLLQYHVGSCIVSPENVVVGVGHHSLVEGMSKDSLEPKDEITDYCE